MINTTLIHTTLIPLLLLLVASPSSLPVTDLCKEVGSNTDCSDENDPLMAVVISMKDNRFESTKEVLLRTGFTVIRRHVPLDHNDPNLLLKFMDVVCVKILDENILVQSQCFAINGTRGNRICIDSWFTKFAIEN